MRFQAWLNKSEYLEVLVIFHSLLSLANKENVKNTIKTLGGTI